MRSPQPKKRSRERQTPVPETVQKIIPKQGLPAQKKILLKNQRLQHQIQKSQRLVARKARLRPNKKVLKIQRLQQNLNKKVLHAPSLRQNPNQKVVHIRSLRRLQSQKVLKIQRLRLNQVPLHPPPNLQTKRPHRAPNRLASPMRPWPMKLGISRIRFCQNLVIPCRKDLYSPILMAI